MWRKHLHPYLSTRSQTYFLGILLCVCSASMVTMAHIYGEVLSFILELHAIGQPRIKNWSNYCLSEEDFELFFYTSTVETTLASPTTTAITVTPNATDLSNAKSSMWINTDRLLSALLYEDLLYFISYTSTQVLGGIISDRLGGKGPILIGITAAALVNLVFPLAIHYEPYLIIPLQVLKGLFLGLYFPSLISIIARWSAPDRRASMTGLCFSGIQFAAALSLGFGENLIITYGWELGFILPGTFCSVTAILFYVWVFSDPDSHPFLTDEQRSKMTENISVLPRHEMAPIPWVKIASTIHVWAILICYWGQKWSQNTLIHDLPMFVRRLIEERLDNPGFIIAFPNLLMGITCAAAGFFEDFVIKKLNTTVNNCRKVIMGCACLIPPVCCLVASYIGCSFAIIYVLYVVGHMGWGLLHSSLQVCVIDVGPNYAGTMTGIVVGFAQTATAAARYCTGLITKENTTENWQMVFWISYLIAGFTYLFAINFGTFEVQKWNNKKMKSYKR